MIVVVRGFVLSRGGESEIDVMFSGGEEELVCLFGVLNILWFWIFRKMFIG